MSTRFNKILVANRGEIACRIIGTARRLGIASVAVYSDADRDAMHVELADEAFRIGPAAASESYLSVPAILEACRASSADAVHPGYGFLAEHGDFAEACVQAGICFIGPPVDALRIMGAKDAALNLAANAGVPVLPGYRGADQSDAALAGAADEIGFPLLLKPVAGGGGKGMRVVESAGELADALVSSRREARSAFADDRLLLERYLAHPRHVELQIFADGHGNVVHLFDRDCSIQRRHQKIVEEAPAPGLSAKLRGDMAATAVALARAIDYRGAGTIEFLVDDSRPGEYFFMEMNTRLQVEHPVTEMILNLDLVEWQIRVAEGAPLPLDQTQLRARGHAVEARVYAEDPQRDFLPATGKLLRFRIPSDDARIRVDTGIREGDEVGIHYDPMIAKIIAYGDDRQDAVRRLRRALSECHIAGLPTNLSLLKRVAASKSFAAAKIDTGFVATLGNQGPDIEDEPTIAAACLYLMLEQAASSRHAALNSKDPHSPWHTLSGWRLNAAGEDLVVLHIEEREHRVPVRYEDEGFTLTLPSGSITVSGRILGNGALVVNLGARKLRADVVRNGNVLDIFLNNKHLRIRCEDRDRPGERHDPISGLLLAPMPGRVISVLVQPGDNVARGQPLMVIEAMKMEHTIRAPSDATVTTLAYAEGDLVDEGVELLTLEAIAAD